MTTKSEHETETGRTPSEGPVPASRLRKALLMAAGVLALALGAAGIFLPLLPTTPFLLLAAACFMRSSEQLYDWLIHHPWFGSYIRNYREYRAITLQAKVTSLVFLWATIGFSIFRVVDSLAVKLLLFAIATGVTVHLVRLRTLTREMLEETCPSRVKTNLRSIDTQEG